MKRTYLSGVLSLLLMFVASVAQAAVSITAQGGWFESAFVEFTPDGSSYYNVYYSTNKSTWTKIDDQLVRKYGSKGRADVIGITAGTYYIKVASVNASGAETSNTISNALTVKAHDRGGFAHLNWSKGIGAYQNNGTLKAGAKVLYVTKSNAKTVSMAVTSSAKGTKTTYTGLQQIIYGYQKGFEKTPLAVRLLGTISYADMDTFLSSSEGLQIKGQGYTDMPITIEGVGNDAVVHGWGFLIRNASDIELRNFAIMDALDDCVSLDTKNSHIWVHNLDLFYGQAGSDADQKKGDGTVDIKGDSKWITVSYNRFWDSGKSSLCGMKSETGPNYITYHHNWFDHSDSRHPRIRTMSVHLYNNYFDGCAKYGVGTTMGSSAFVESNYFRGTKSPMMRSKNGTDAKGVGTFSGEATGYIKAYGNILVGAKSFIAATSSATTGISETITATSSSYDAVVVNNKATKLSDGYDNFDTNASVMCSYTADAASDVPAIVTGTYGAGRLQHGSFKYTFSSSDDSNYSVIPALKSQVEGYKSTSYYTGVTSAMYFKSNVISNEASAPSTDTKEDPTPEPEPTPVVKAQTPSIAVGTYTPGKGYAVTISTTDGSAVYYSTDGSNFTKGNSLYVAGKTVSAYAVLNANNETKSSIATKSVSAAPVAATPSINATANGDGTQYTVTISAEAGATIHYTTDGSNPTTASAKYVSTLTITSNCTVKAIAVAANKENSAVASKAVTVATIVTPEPEPEPVKPSTPAASNDICSFNGNTPSLSAVTVKGNYSTSKGSATFNGNTYKTCVKMESATLISVTLDAETDVTFVFGSTAAGKQFKLNGAVCTLDSEGALTKTLQAGSYNITKSSSINLFAIAFAKQVVEDPTTWNFSDVASKVILAGSNYTYSYKGLTIVGNTTATYTSDYLTKSGFHCNGGSSATMRYIKYTATSNGALTVNFISNKSTDTKRTSAIGTAVGTPIVKASCAQGTMSANVEAGKTYYIYFVSGGQTIKSITMTPGATVAQSLDADFEDYETAINEVENVETTPAKTAAKKMFVNGKLVIVKGGKMFNIDGSEL